MKQLRNKDMLYNGIELEELTSEKWDGRSREMLVWSDYDAKPTLALVCGFTLKGHPIADIGNYKKENAHKNYVVFQYCAEIPNDSELSEFEIDNFLPSRHEVQQYLDAEDYLDENGILVDAPSTAEAWFSLACTYMIKKHIRPLLKEIAVLKSKNDNKG